MCLYICIHALYRIHVFYDINITYYISKSWLVKFPLRARAASDKRSRGPKVRKKARSSKTINNNV